MRTNALCDRLFDAAEDAGDDIKTFALKFIDSDLASLSLDFQPSSFDASFGTFASAVNDTLVKSAERVPPMKPLLQDLKFRREQKVRFADEIATTCRREFGNAVQQLTSVHARVRGAKGYLAEAGTMNWTSVAKGIGAVKLAAVMPFVGVPLLIGHMGGVVDRMKQTEQRNVEIAEALAEAVRWAEEAEIGRARARIALADSIKEKYQRFVNLLLRAFLESGIASGINWEAMCDAHLSDRSIALRGLCADAPRMRDELERLDLDPEIVALLAALPVVDAPSPAAERDAFLDGLSTELALAKAAGQPLSVVVFDVDRLGRLNEQYGRAAGTAALTMVLERVAALLRPGDVLARYRDDEFIVALPGVTLASAGVFGERVRSLAEDSPIDKGGVRLSLTLSVGVAGHPATADTPRQLVAHAREAMTEAKRCGANRVLLKSER